MYRISFFLLAATFLLHADIEDHFVPVLNKTNGHSFGNIDFIYLINLDQRPEKLQMSLKQLKPYGINPFRFPAVNGWELSIDAINEIGVKFTSEMEGDFMGTSYHQPTGLNPSHEIIHNLGQTYFIHTLAPGAIGCAMSHLSVLQDAYDSGYETIWIMEDDIEILKDPSVIPDLIDQLDRLVGEQGWDILFTDRDFRNSGGWHAPGYGATKRLGLTHLQFAQDFSFKKDISPEFRQIANRYGTHSMILRRSGVKKLLQFFKAHQLFAPYDMDLIYARGLKMFTVTHDIVGNLPQALSDVGYPHYLNTEKKP